MSIDEQIDEYMNGWEAGCNGANPSIVDFSRRIATSKPDWSRGVRDGAASRMAAEQAERERLERLAGCSCVSLHEFAAGDWHAIPDPLCPACHGTGKREVTK
jgi:hypothetical protein